MFMTSLLLELNLCGQLSRELFSERRSALAEKPLLVQKRNPCSGNSMQCWSSCNGPWSVSIGTNICSFRRVSQKNGYWT